MDLRNWEGYYKDQWAIDATLLLLCDSPDGTTSPQLCERLIEHGIADNSGAISRAAITSCYRRKLIAFHAEPAETFFTFNKKTYQHGSVSLRLTDLGRIKLAEMREEDAARVKG